MATTIVTKKGSGAPAASDLVEGELAVDTTNGRLYTENSSAAVVELGSNPSGNITFGDNGKAIFGAGSDATLHSDGSAGYARGFVLQNTAGNKDVLNFVDGGAATLFHNNAAKIATTATGIDVTGTVTADGLTVGSSSVVADVTTGGSTPFFKVKRGTTSQANLVASFHNDNDAGIDVHGNGDISFYEDTGTTAKFFWDASAESLGIGALTSTSTGRYHYIQNAAGNETYPVYSFQGDSNTGIMSDTADTLSLVTGGDTRVRIDSSGNVGIGATPNQILTLDKASGDVFTRFDKGGAIKGLIGVADTAGAGSGSSAQGDMIVRGQSRLLLDTVGTTRVLIDSSGNVGIGTDSPPEGFAIGATSSVAGFSIGSGDTQTFLRYNNYFSGTAQVSDATKGTASISLGRSSDGVITFNTAAAGAGVPTEAMRIESDGNLRVYDVIDNIANTLTLNGRNTGQIHFQSGGTEKMRMDASGNVGIGTSSPTTPLAVHSDAGVVIKIDGDTANTSRTLLFRSVGTGEGIVQTDGNMHFLQEDASRYMRFSTANTEAMRLDASGNLLVGCSTLASIDNTPSDTGIALRSSGAQMHSVGNGGNAVEFRINGTGAVGSINCSGSATAYNTSSDQRLKDNIVDAPSASDDIDAIQVRSFDWKVDGSHQKYGMVAQELKTVAPEAVSAPEDPEEMMGVDYSKLVPMMLKEIQSLRARVAQLES